MPVGFVASFANEILNHAFRGVGFTPATTYYVKFHTGDPGAAGAANAAGNATRKLGTFGTAPSGGGLSNTAIISWTEAQVTTNETYSHVSLWDAAVAGNCKMTGTLPIPRPVTSGAAVDIKVGELNITLAVAA